MSDLNARIGAALVERLGEGRARELRVVRRIDSAAGYRSFWSDFSTGDGMLALIGAMRELGIPLFWLEWDSAAAPQMWRACLDNGVEAIGAEMPHAVMNAAARALGLEVQDAE
jgi:hypothetical protein